MIGFVVFMAIGIVVIAAAFVLNFGPPEERGLRGLRKKRKNGKKP